MLQPRGVTFTVIAPDTPDIDWLFNGIAISGNFDGNRSFSHLLAIIVCYFSHSNIFTVGYSSKIS